MYCRRKYRKSHKLLLSLILSKKYFIFKFLYINIVHVGYFALALFYVINITVIYTDTHICVCAPVWMRVKGLCKYVNIKSFPCHSPKHFIAQYPPNCTHSLHFSWLLEIWAQFLMLAQRHYICNSNFFCLRKHFDYLKAPLTF